MWYRMGFKKRKLGLTLVEIIIAIAIGTLIVGASLGLYVVASRTFSQLRPIMVVKETVKTGLDQLEWFFQRWGFGVPCANPSNVTACINMLVDNSTSSIFSYPPTSSLYIRIIRGSPCDEVWFFGSIGGEGFITRTVGINQVAAMSCRLSSNKTHNCYHIWRGARHIVNANTTISLSSPETGYSLGRIVLSTREFPLIFQINNLSRDNLDCSRESNPDNAFLNIRAQTTCNCYETWNGTQRIYTKEFLLEPQDLLIRVPHLIHIFCKEHPQDNNHLWIYVETFDLSSNCTANEPPMPIVRVNSFRVTPLNNGILVNLEIASQDRVVRVERFYGR